jgi:protein subunit release factor B
MNALGLREEDLEERFIRGAGPGGQKINKTSSTVVITHLPTGMEVRCQRERSQLANRHWARVELCDRVESQRNAERLAKKQAREKKRRQNRPRPRGVKERILKDKRQRSDLKKKRGRVRGDD